MHWELLPADREAHDGEFVDGGVGREEVPLLRGIVFAARDGVVDGFAGAVVDEGEGRAGVGDGFVAGSFDGLAGYDGGAAVEHPEALGFVDGGVVGRLAAEGRLIDVAEGVEGFALVGVVDVFDGAEVGGEKFRGLRDVVLGDHVLDRGLDRIGCDGVDGTEGEAEEPVAAVLLELGRKGFGQLDGLVFDNDATNVNDVRSDRARGRGSISVGNLPGRPGGIFERAGLGGVEDGMLGAFYGGCRQLGGPKLYDCQRWLSTSKQDSMFLPIDRLSQCQSPE